MVGVTKSPIHKSLANDAKCNVKLAHARVIGNEERKHNDYHVKINRDADCHAIVNHDANRLCRKKSDQPKGDVNSQTEKQPMLESKHPWKTPQVLAKYLALRMKTMKPTMWSIDDYGGVESWTERKEEPPLEFPTHVEMNANQYHNLTHKLYQYKNKLDDLLAQWNDVERNETQINTWKRIQTKVQEMCVEMHQEMEFGKCDDGVDKEKLQTQFTHAEQQDDTIRMKLQRRWEQFQMFDKKRKTSRNKQPIEENSSDEEHDDQLVCNMMETNWESLTFPIIIDSRACVPIMPTGWCDHVPIRVTQQSKAREFFRASNGQKIHNHGERVVSMMTRGGHERHALYCL